MRSVWHVRARGECRTLLCCRNLKERHHLEGLDIEGRIILKWILKKYEGWHGLGSSAQDRDKWRAFVNMVMNLRVPLRYGEFLEFVN